MESSWQALASQLLMLMVSVGVVRLGGAQIVIAGGGASFPQEIYTRWFALYQQRQGNSVQFNYQATGSSAGKKWIAGSLDPKHYPPIVFGASDMALTKEEINTFPELQMFPMVAGAVVIVYASEAIVGLRMSQHVLVQIYNGNITRWNDTQIQELNEDVLMPTDKIVLIARRDGSGTTYVFTQALQSFNQLWNQDRPATFKEPDLTPDRTSKNWPPTVRLFAALTGGVAGTMTAMDHSMSYMSQASVAQDFDSLYSNFKTVHLQNKAGNFLDPAHIIQAIETSMTHMSDTIDETLEINLTNPPDPTAYPIGTVSYLIVNKTTSDTISCVQMQEFVKFLKWALLDPAAREAVREVRLVPLSEALAKKVEAVVLNKILCRGRLVIDLIAEEEWTTKQIVTLTAILVALSAVLSPLLFYLWRYRYTSMIMRRTWFIPTQEIIFHGRTGAINSQLFRHNNIKSPLAPNNNQQQPAENNDDLRTVSQASHRSKNSLLTLFSAKFTYHANIDRVFVFLTGLYKAKPVILSEYPMAYTESSGKEGEPGDFNKGKIDFKLKTGKWIYAAQKELEQRNISEWHGITEIRREEEGKEEASLNGPNHIAHANPTVFTTFECYFVFEAGVKGSLHEVLKFSPYDLNEDVKINLAMDVTAGLSYLHKHKISHGMLDTWNCFLDRSWNVKIGNWSQTMVTLIEEGRSPFMKETQQIIEDEDTVEIQRTLFKHPNYLQLSSADKEITIQDFPKHEDDLHSLAMIYIEIFTREHPYTHFTETWPVVLQKVAQEAMLPTVTDEAIPLKIRNIVKLIFATCSSQIMELESMLRGKQPTATSIHEELTASQKKKKAGIVETLMDAMKEYTDNLENTVEERTQELKLVGEQMHRLLVRMLPKEVAEDLQAGRTIQPIYYDSATVYFSDIVSFTSMCAESTPMEVVAFLNKLYTIFDEIIGRFDVYKVETIGDSYMCVSGVPKRNGDDHVREVAGMSLTIRESLSTFVIPHRPDTQFAIRTGIHTGPVTAGVVGLTMPRYCLFGDTVNVASRMESTSESNRIQMSRQAAHALTLHKNFSEFKLENRGNVAVKGKGELDTFWLEWDDNF